ncbi:hypothetical protein HH310_41765 [Actinoplanes sp. TBRC 11911]|uniref:hypothetical protein n=1 Tax=Actinoplanes sp. TBRC 11911 TaxID=2729386 RepID=UPI00145E5DA6|nr:hypothetical protein [Actinoplanes sp. TBRC 11911]NMO57681.1 hypothetical protein [Actinoplanes sp. TBRC 11911]
MRYLTRQFAIGASRRSNGIEQFLGGAEIDDEPAIRWVAISPMNKQYRVTLHTVQDPDDDRVADLSKLLSLDPVDEAYAGGKASAKTKQNRYRSPNTSPALARTAGSTTRQSAKATAITSGLGDPAQARFQSAPYLAHTKPPVG